MAFLNRLFHRKSKAELVSTPQSSLRRSLTDPNPPSGLSSVKSRRSSSDDKDVLDMLPSSRRGAARTRRAGCDFGRSKTSLEVGSVRSSSSSAAEPASSSADGSKGRYRQLQTLRRSRLHTISAAQDRSSKLAVVIKAFPKNRLTSSVRAKLESEVHHLRALAGVAGVVNLIDTFEDEDNAYIVLERCAGTTLIELAANCGGRLSEQMLVTDVLIPLTLTLADLHRQGVVHRQIKPEHILCNTASAAVTVVDFSEAVNKKQRCLNNRAGSLEYMAPEVLTKPTAEEVFHQVLYNGMSEEELPQYDEKADVWSLGALVFEALTGCQPFLADTPSDMGRLQRELLTVTDTSGTPRVFEGKPGLSPEARAFLMLTLQLDPLNRPSADRLLQQPLVQRYWACYQAKQVALLSSSNSSGTAAEAGCTSVPGTASRSGQVNGSSIVVGDCQGFAAAVTTVPVTGRPAGSGGCAVPAAAHKASLLVTAPLQFPVR